MTNEFYLMDSQLNIWMYSQQIILSVDVVELCEHLSTKEMKKLIELETK